MPTNKSRPKTSFINKRAMSKGNMERFKDCLNNLSWNNVTRNNNVDEAFNLFWTEFKIFYDLCFPSTKSKFNKNIHAKQSFMTKGLLVSRGTKSKLHKKYLNDPCPINKLKYITYRNLYSSIYVLAKNFTTSRASKIIKKIRKKLGIL